MAALAYVLLPLSGVIAFLVGGSARIRFHGLQAIAVGTVWAVAAYAASWIAPLATVAVFGVGAVVWFVLVVSTLLGRDLRLPGAGPLKRLAEDIDDRGL